MLAFLALFAGLVQVPGVDDVVTNFLDPVFADSPLAAIDALDSAPTGSASAIGGVDLAGRDRDRLLPLRRQPELPGGAGSSACAPLHTFLVNKWYFDEAIDFLVVRPALAIGRFANRVFERFVVDGLVSGTEETVRGAGGVVRAVQNGFVRSYALLLIAGFAGLALYFLLSSS